MLILHWLKINTALYFSHVLFYTTSICCISFAMLNFFSLTKSRMTDQFVCACTTRNMPLKDINIFSHSQVGLHTGLFFFSLNSASRIQHAKKILEREIDLPHATLNTVYVD